MSSENPKEKPSAEHLERETNVQLTAWNIMGQDFYLIGGIVVIAVIGLGLLAISGHTFRWFPWLNAIFKWLGLS